MIYGQELWKVKLEDPPVITAVQQSATDKRSFTITGSNLSTTSAVYFAGAAATSFTVISDTEIVAMVPNVDASGIVIVNTAGGSATKSGFVFSVVPVLTSFAPVIGVTGSHIILKGSQFTGVNSVSFGGKSASSFVITSDTEIDAVVGAETSSGEVSVTRNTQVGSLAGFTFYGPPVIESLTPSAALRGSEVTVKGKNFYLVSSILLGSINVTEFTIIGTEELKFIVPGKALTGDLKITAASGTVTTQLVVEIPVGVEDSELSDQIEFYPNPVERILQIAYNEELTSEAAIRMFDSRGVPVSGFQIHGTRGRWEVDMQAVATGMYVLLLNRGGKFSKVFKVIKK